MGKLITDEILEEFAIVAEPGKVVGALKQRFGGLVDRALVSFGFAKQADRSAYMAELRGD
jgi:hypothetical protein